MAGDRRREYEAARLARAAARAAGKPLRPNRSEEALERRRAYTREWRARHRPEPKVRRPPAPEPPPIGPLFPDLARGVHVSFWDEELACDIRQERALAELEGRDPDKAEQLYRKREQAWFLFAGQLLLDPTG